MPGKPPKAPKGYLTPKQLAEKAKEKGLDINPKVLADNAHKGKIRFWESIPGRKKGVMFPEEKLIQVIADSPKKAIVPKKLYTARDIYQMAKEKGLTVNQWHIVEKLRRIFAGKEPSPKGLLQDAWHPRHRYFFPKQFVKEIIAEARHRKKLPALLEKGRVLTIKEFAKEINLSVPNTLKRTDLKKFMDGGKYYVTRREADHFKKKYVKGRRYKTAEEIAAKKVPDWRTIQEVEWRMKNIVGRIKNRKTRERVKKLLLDNRGLPYDKFKRTVLAEINKILADKKKG